ncbi:MAG TPA: rhodanese-like domain-containing protein [Ferruginibacter sp.]|nr:rhodanese-like domain-containing protein [Ferruginibacter sp.]
MQHSEEFLNLVNEAKKQTVEISVMETLQKIKNGAHLIDVREDNEWNDGHAKDAIHLGRGILERDIVNRFPDKAEELVLYCGGGFRSALSADNLKKMGYNKVYSMEGGWKAWKESGAPIE